MKPIILRARRLVAEAMGVTADNKVLWAPDIPIVYIDNPKSGSSTIKFTIKQAQAAEFDKAGRAFNRSEEPHKEDDCLWGKGLRSSALEHRFVISCVRNPYTRVLSAFLDKFPRINYKNYPELRHRKGDTFEDYLQAVSEYPARKLNFHIRPQHLNLGFPDIDYDAIFYLENLSAMSRYFDGISQSLTLETFAPHSRSARTKIREHYTDRTVDLVQQVYAEDFSSFGYSTNLDDVDVIPGECIVNGRIVLDPEEVVGMAARRPARSAASQDLEAMLRYHQVVEALFLY